jgi:fibrillarin-like pre-rRNA processing protein
LNQLQIQKRYDNGSYLILTDNANGKFLATQNLIDGNSVYGEKIIKFDDIEYRLWDPFRSKLAGAIMKGLKENPIKESSRVL